MKKYGKELEFISRISRDGKEVFPVTLAVELLNKNDIFSLTPLSISKETFIASGFNTYVVKIKEK